MRRNLAKWGMKRLLLCGLSLCMCSLGVAADLRRSTAVFVGSVQSFAVSGILRKPTEDVVIKLMQSVETARSEEEAIGQFARKAQTAFPGYAVMDTIVTTLPSKQCETRI